MAKQKLSKAERKRKAKRAKKKMIPAMTKKVGKKGFRWAKKKLAGKPGVKSEKKLAGWYKAKAKKAGLLSKKHPYVGRKKK